MEKRYACINDLPITETDRKFYWPQGRRPNDHASLSDLGLQNDAYKKLNGFAFIRKKLNCFLQTHSYYFI